MQVNKRQEAYEAWMNNRNDTTTENLLKALEPVVQASLKSYAAGNQNLKTKANIMLLKALDSYDTDKGIQLNTYVMNQLQSLTRVARQRSNMAHIPENIHYNKLAIKKAKDEYFAKHGEDPDDTELADDTGIAVKHIQQANKYQQALPASTGVSDKGDFMGDNKREALDIWSDYVYHDLDKKDKIIFKHVTGYQGAKIKPKSIIASDIGMTPAAVSQRVAKITKQLQEVSTNGND